jgi:hypothetical protein
MPPHASYPRVSLATHSHAALTAIRLTTEGMHASASGDPGRRTMGLLGELAASLYLFASHVPFYEARERQAKHLPTPDLYPYDGLEIKTLTKPSHVLAPVDHVFNLDEPVDTLYVRYAGTDQPDTSAFDMIGWITAEAARCIWNESQRTFTDGWRCIPVGCLTPADTCPWRLES